MSQLVFQENWFYYWRTSAALWEKILKEDFPHEQVWVLLNWGAHSNDGNRIDFGEVKPELNLARFIAVARKSGKRVSLFLPVGPHPSLPLGGFPAQLAREGLKGDGGINLFTVFEVNKFTSIGSPFDADIFKSFRKFLWSLQNHLLNEQISIPTYGLVSCYQESGEWKNFWQDQSETFDLAYQRFTKLNPGVENSKESRRRFQSQVCQLFVECIKESAKDSWQNLVYVNYPGVGNESFWGLNHGCFEFNLELNIQEALENNCLVAFSHFPEMFLTESRKYLKEKWINQYLLRHHIEKDDLEGQLKPYVLINLYLEDLLPFFEKTNLENLGLNEYLKKEFSGLYRYQREIKFDPQLLDQSHQQWNFYLRNDFDLDSFHKVIKAFIAGETWILPKSSLNSELTKKLYAFTIENNLKKESAHFVAPVELLSLGEGRLIVYDDKILREKIAIDQNKFWIALFQTHSWQLPAIELDPKAVAFWKRSDSAQEDFNYNAKVRLTLVNTSDDELWLTIPMDKRFPFLKSIDPHQAQFKSKPLGLELCLFSRGMISLDFGVIED